MQLALGSPIALGLPQNLLSAQKPLIPSSYSAHRTSLSQFEHHFDTLFITLTNRSPFPHTSLSLGRFLGQDMTVMAVSPLYFS